MGNKIGTKRKSPSSNSSSDGSKKPEVKRRQKKNGSSASGTAAASSRDKQVISCPDLSGAVPYGFEEEEERDNDDKNNRDNKKSSIDVKIYRSFTNVADPNEKQRLSALAGPPPDIRVYRRSTGSLAAAAQDPDRSQTLPKSFGRTRGATGSAAHHHHHQQQQRQSQQGHSNGSLPKDRRSDGGDGVVRRRSTLGSGYNLGTTKGSRRTLSTASMNSIGYKVNPDDFPDTATIQRRLTHFETTFVRNFVEAFFSSDLSPGALLSLLSIAVRPNRSGHPVTLLQYLESAEVPANLHVSGGSLHPEYVLTIPQILFKEVFRIRQEKVSDVKDWTDIGRHIMSCQAMEAANELSRVFEYQLVLMPEGVAMELLCRHSAECVRQFIKKNNGHIDRNSIVHGVIRGHVRVPEVCPKFSIIIGERELKWNLFEILKKPGLRKELLLTSEKEELDVERTPWKFFCSSKTDQMLYGYRALVVDWDFAAGSYRLDAGDEGSFPDEMDWRPDDFHRDYNPYRRLVGLDAMRDFCSSDRSTGAALGDYVMTVQGRSYARDRIQPVYRPVGDGAADDLPALESVNLGNADTLRLRKGGGKGRRRPESTTARPREAESRPPHHQRASEYSDNSVFLPSSLDGGQEKRTSGRSMDTSPSLSQDVRLSSVASTLSQDSRGSSYRTCRENSQTETDHTEATATAAAFVPTLRSPRCDDSSGVAGQTLEGNSPKVGIIYETRFDDDDDDDDETVKMSENVAAETTPDNEGEAESVQKRNLAVPSINRRSTVTSSV